MVLGFYFYKNLHPAKDNNLIKFKNIFKQKFLLSYNINFLDSVVLNVLVLFWLLSNIKKYF